MRAPAVMKAFSAAKSVRVRDRECRESREEREDRKRGRRGYLCTAVVLRVEREMSCGGFMRED